MRLYTSNMLQQAQISKIGAQITLDIPSKIYLDMTPDCNLYCIMCRESIENSGRIMPLDMLKRIVDETYKGVSSYSMFNSGESLLLKDFRKRVEYIAKHKRTNTSIDLSTNGMLLEEEISKFLINNDVEVCVSFDGSKAEIFENIRRGSNFKLICQNLERIATYASKMNPFRAPGIGITIQKQNWVDLVNIIAMANCLGVRRVSMWPVFSSEQLHTNKDLVNMIARAIHFADKKGMAVDLYPTRLENYIWDGDSYVSTDNFLIDDKCNAPLTCTGINWDGDVYLCCNYGAKVENMNNKSFQEIWRGSNYERFRLQVNNNDMPTRCKHCFWVNRY